MGNYVDNTNVDGYWCNGIWYPYDQPYYTTPPQPIYYTIPVQFFPDESLKEEIKELRKEVKKLRKQIGG